MNLGPERVQFPERFFTQSQICEGFTGFQSMVSESISRADLDIRKDLYSNVILSGGNANLKGLEKRLERQIPDIAPQGLRVKVLRGADVKTSAWVGGSILSSLGSF